MRSCGLPASSNAVDDVSAQVAKATVSDSAPAYPVSEEKKAAALIAARELGKSVGYDIDADPDKLWKTFCEFDKDMGGTVDHGEFTAMIESLGMVLSKAEVKVMIEKADADKSGDIDFGEFAKVVLSKEGDMAKLFARKKDALTMAWRKDRVGPNVEFDGPIAKRAGDGFGVALLGVNGSGAAWLGEDHPTDKSKKLNKGSALLEINCPAGCYVRVGVVDKNFQADQDGAFPHFEQEFSAIDNRKKDKITSVQSSNGEVVRHAQNLSDPACGGLKLAKFGHEKNYRRVQLEIDSRELSLTVRRLDAKKDFEKDAEVVIEKIKPVVAVAVCFGPTTGGEYSSVRLIGSSCEAVAAARQRRASKDLWDEENVQGVRETNNGTGPSMNELNGA